MSPCSIVVYFNEEKNVFEEYIINLMRCCQHHVWCCIDSKKSYCPLYFLPRSWSSFDVWRFLSCPSRHGLWPRSCFVFNIAAERLSTPWRCTRHAFLLNSIEFENSSMMLCSSVLRTVRSVRTGSHGGSHRSDTVRQVPRNGRENDEPCGRACASRCQY